MNLDALNKANIDNLTSLWKKYGHQSFATNLVSGFNASSSWPHRYWFDWETKLPEQNCVQQMISEIPAHGVVAVWDDAINDTALLEQQLLANGFTIAFEQAAMYLPLMNAVETKHAEIVIETVNTPQALATWAMISGQAFGYEIDAAVIQQLAGDPNIMLFMAYRDDQPAATAMLYKTGDTIGIHQVGVVKQHQRKGLAHALMVHVLNQCHAWQGRIVTLQASEAGAVLYRRLGFRYQFNIRNYQWAG